MVFIVDGSPDVISVVVDGQLCDGNMKRQWGFGRIPHELGDVNTGSPMQIDNHVESLRIYDRSLTTAEAVSNYRATREEQ